MKKFTLSILGCGSRGCDSYGQIAFPQKEKYEIVSLCDVNPLKVEKYGKIFSVPYENRFLDEDEFFSKRRSNALIIASLDQDHVRQCLKAMALGYDILLEKPISSNENELYELLEAQKKYGSKVMVCHVLRYAPAFVKVKELLDSGVVGELVSIDATEQIAFWHFAHSYVRGNWHKVSDTAPMILAKSCHDLDLLQYYAKSRAVTVNSLGGLAHFKNENKPEDSTERCLDCPYKSTCPYSAYAFYVEHWKNTGAPDNCWPYNVVVPELPVTEEKMLNALRNGNYGKCVYACDNDACDNQMVLVGFENGVSAILKTIAFTHDCGRIMKFYGTKGEIEFDETRGIIVTKPFGTDATTILVKDLVEKDEFGHGGGDYYLMSAFYDMLCGNENSETTLEKSVESHLMGIAAEKSRTENGKSEVIKH